MKTMESNSGFTDGTLLSENGQIVYVKIRDGTNPISRITIGPTHGKKKGGLDIQSCNKWNRLLVGFFLSEMKLFIHKEM